MLRVYSSLALLEMVVWGSVNIIVIQNKETFFNEFSSVVTLLQAYAGVPFLIYLKPNQIFGNRSLRV